MEKIGVIGIGRLGLCLALNLEKSGYTVYGADKSANYVEQLNKKEFSSPEPFVNEYLKSSRNFFATTSIHELLDQKIELIFVVVPTPSKTEGDFDHSAIDAVAADLKKSGKQNHPVHIVISSTCMPGYCDSLQKELTEYNFVVTYNPEFIAQGSIIENQQRPDQILIGEHNKDGGDKLQVIYERICKNKPVYCRMSLISAEITKLATNCFLTTKISFANAIGDLAVKSDAEPEKILAAIGADSRIGNKYFKYGFGFGGPCFPRDNKAFINFASSKNYQMLISDATDKANENHSDFLFEQWSEQHKEESEIIFDSVTYKKGTDILEESQQLKLALALARSGKKVRIKESAAVIKVLKDLYGNLFIYSENDS